ncbi:MAG: hypothetical protein ACRC7G_09810 [Beijerinckiaceae bacterium]
MRGVSAAFVVAVSLGLGGCGGGIFGTEGTGNTVANYLAFGSATPPPSLPEEKVETEYGCPSVNVIEGAAGYRGGSARDQATGVAFQASLIASARECNFTGNQLRLSVGIEGRLLLGQNGRPGTFQVPVRIIVKRRNDIVAQRSSRISVTVPANDTQNEFATVDQSIVLPISSSDPGDEYDIYVGLDPTSAQTAAARRRR